MIMVSVFCLTGCNEKTTSDALKFKNEYESLNGQKNDAGKTYPEVKIEKNNIVEYVDEAKALDILNYKTGIIYMGYNSCPWCRNAVPVLLDAAKKSNIDKIYYLDMKEIRDEKELGKDGKIVVKKEGSKGYQELLVRMYDFLEEYDGLQDSSIKRIYVPFVVAVKEGKILSVHADTVYSQTDPYQVLDKDQKQELKNIYVEMMQSVSDGLCTEKGC